MRDSHLVWDLSRRVGVWCGVWCCCLRLWANGGGGGHQRTWTGGMSPNSCGENLQKLQCIRFVLSCPPPPPPRSSLWWLLLLRVTDLIPDTLSCGGVLLLRGVPWAVEYETSHYLSQYAKWSAKSQSRQTWEESLKPMYIKMRLNREFALHFW